MRAGVAWLGALLLAVLATLACAQPGERILAYDVEIDIQRDGSLVVAEHITVRAEQDRIRRGIYRDFPTRYRYRYGNRVEVHLEVLGVERDGVREPWFIERRSNGVRINTGGDELLPRFPAEYRYTLRYRTGRQLGFFAAHDEVYWNAIGTGWDFTIEAATVELRLPAPVPVEQLTAEAYTGRQGEAGQAYRAEIVAPGMARYALTAPLASREGFTVVLAFPKGIVAAPTRAERARSLLADNSGLLVMLVGFAALIAYCTARWRNVGRDPRGGAIIARYEPPDGRSPAELRYLRRRSYDPRCFTSDLLVAAVDGQIEIERQPRALLGDRWFVQRASRGGSSAALPTVSALAAQLLGSSGRLELAKKNANRLQHARAVHSKALDRRLHGSHFRRHLGSVAVAAAITLAVAVFAFAVQEATGGGGGPAMIAALVAMGIVVAVFAWLVQAPTSEGRALLDEAEGLRLYLSVAERDELAAIGGPRKGPALDAERYERLLPYAVALDVEDAWTDKFTAAVGAAEAAAATAHIAWYHGGRADNLGGIAKAVGAGLSASIASAATPPGSSSGSGGGGFSGGGGGGGGGGGR